MKVCIIGNGASVLKKQNGSFIDSCEVVVRIKNFKIENYEKFVGTKTDIFSSKWFSWYDRDTNEPLTFNFIPEIKTLLYMFPMQSEIDSTDLNDKHDYVKRYVEMQLKGELIGESFGWEEHLNQIELFKLKQKELVYFTIPDIENLCCNILKLHKIPYIVKKKQTERLIEPTCGIRTIYKIIQTYKQHEIFLTGFDGFRTSWYWNTTHKINPTHHYLTERLYLTKLEKEKRITFIDK